MKHVYFLRPEGQSGPIKIGCSDQPMKRLRAVETWSPVQLEVAASAPGGYAHERMLHYRFGAQRLHGEWFAESAELNSVIAHVAATGSLPPMEIPSGASEWREAESKAIRRKGRNPSLHAAKCRLTNRITSAEKHAFGYDSWQNRPDEIANIIASYQGFSTGMPGDAALAIIDEYCARLLAMPKQVRSWDNWRAWADRRDAGRAA